MNKYHGEDEIPERLLRDLAKLPVIPEEDIDKYVRSGRRSKLTERELEVLRCISYGLDYKMTAQVLGISVESVQAHLKSARYLLKAKNTTHAVAVGIRNGLI